VFKANKTQAALGTLTTQLKETKILVDNIINASLRLEEGENNAVVFSVIVRLDGPYQDRALPYVIGSNKKIISNNIAARANQREEKIGKRGRL
ncbi:hypothetical protein ALC62_07018, partial [Cyphomyrmex costatus]